MDHTDDTPLLLDIQNLSKSFTSGDRDLTILKDVSFQVKSGQTLAITGPSGSGKSTLLNALGGLDNISSGDILYAGRSLRHMSENELALYRNHEVGFIFQLHHLLPQCTAFENVLLPVLAFKNKTDAADCERAKDLLHQVGLDDRLDHYPSQLSGGERQRAALARALINKPKLLLADEPTGSLDQRSAGEVADILIRLNESEKTTLIMVTHAPSLADTMSVQFEIKDSTLVPAIT
jgi:ABC-type lipoprotein export system ATPase subunit